MTPQVTPTADCHSVPPGDGKETTVGTTPDSIPVRALYRVHEATVLLSLSKSAIYEELRAGRLQSVCRGRSRLIPANAIAAYVQLLITESEASHGQAA